LLNTTCEGYGFAERCGVLPAMPPAPIQATDGCAAKSPGKTPFDAKPRLSSRLS
jgi:hypothetical protein